MAVAVVGASGLIGAAVAESLTGSGQVVTVGRRAGCDLRVDLADPEAVGRVDWSGIEAVVHCAGVTDEQVREDTAGAYVRSTVGFSRLIDGAARAGVRCIVYFSTAHVYGSLEGRISEHTPPNPLSDYAIAHYSAEQILRRAAAGGPVRCLVLRPCAVYGMPRDPGAFGRWGLIPYSFPREAVETGRITLRSHGEQRRNFVSTADLAQYAGKYLAREAPNPPFAVVNPVGPYSDTVYGYAVRCAAVAAAVLGRACPVDRPAPPGTLPPELDYTSGSVYHEAADTTAEYLEAMVRFLVKVRSMQDHHEP